MRYLAPSTLAAAVLLLLAACAMPASVTTRPASTTIDHIADPYPECKAIRELLVKKNAEEGSVDIFQWDSRLVNPSGVGTQDVMYRILDKQGKRRLYRSTFTLLGNGAVSDSFTTEELNTGAPPRK